MISVIIKLSENCRSLDEELDARLLGKATGTLLSMPQQHQTLKFTLDIL